MKKLQPKIFIDTEVSLETGYNISTGYSIGQVIHFNDTGKEYYHSTDGVWKPVGGSASSQLILITYSELSSLISVSGLTIGTKYLITDYQTVHTIPNTEDTNTGEVEPLLVTAITLNQLANECYSLIYPQDIIYYDIENDQTMVAGCTKGYIYRRIDTKQNNDIPFDFRQVPL